MVFGGENADSYYDEGLTASMKGDFELAVQHFERALGLEPELIPAMHQLGRCYLRMGEPHRAGAILQKAIHKKPGQIPPRLDMGYALLDLNLPDKARAVFNQVAQSKPDNARANLGLAYCAFQQGDWNAAAILAQGSTAQGGANFAALFLWGRAAKLAGELDFEEALHRAESAIEKSIETSPDQPEGYYLRGEVHFTRADFGKALEDYTAADARAKPGKHYSAFNEHFDRADVLAKAGLCHERMGNAEGAREAGRQVLELNPEHAIGQSLAGD